jgi:hypothetical protein
MVSCCNVMPCKNIYEMQDMMPILYDMIREMIMLRCRSEKNNLRIHFIQVGKIEK